MTNEAAIIESVRFVIIPSYGPGLSDNRDCAPLAFGWQCAGAREKRGRERFGLNWSNGGVFREVCVRQRNKVSSAWGYPMRSSDEPTTCRPGARPPAGINACPALASIKWVP